MLRQVRQPVAARRLVWAALALLPVAAPAQERPETVGLRAMRPPVIDGRGDEAAWERAAPLSLVDVRDLQGRRHPRATEVRLLWDDDALYVLFTCFDPDVWSTLTQRDAPLYEEEVIELFIDPDGDGRNYVEIEVNAVNTVFDVLVAGGGGSRPDWNPDLRTAVSVDGSLNDAGDVDRSWTVELALPWPALATQLLDVAGGLSLPPRVGDEWRFNFYRYERPRAGGVETGDVQYSAWSPVGRVDFHVPDRFGHVVFGDQDGGTGDRGYPQGTLVPAVDLGLREVEVHVPEAFRDQVPEGLRVQLPPGFSARVYAVGFRWPRFMAFDDDGVLHLADPGAGHIVALPDRDGDSVADEHLVAAQDFRLAHSLAFHGGDLYVADTHQVLRLRDADDDGRYEQRQVWIDDIPSQGWHTTRTLVIDAARDRLYLGVGSPCDLCRSSSPVDGGTDEPLPPSPEWGSILQFRLDGSGRRVFATGVRNAVGLALHPVSGELWGNNNGHDLEGRTRPPEWIDIIRDGDFLGHPLVHSHQVFNDFSIPRYQRLLPITRQDSLLAARQKRPVALVPAHYAPMGLHFYTHDQFPAAYRHAAFVAFRAGRAKLSSHAGYNVSVLFSDADGAGARMGEFLTGFQTGTTQQSVWGFPVGLATDGQGSLYVGSDARTRLVLKVTYSPVAGTWEYDLPDTVAIGQRLSLAATVRVEQAIAGGGPLQVTADLSQLGGPSDLPLEPLADGTFRLEHDLDVAAASGRHALRVRLAQQVDGEWKGFELIKTIALLPGSDARVLVAGGDPAWRSDGEAGAIEPVVAAPEGGGPDVFQLRTGPAAEGLWRARLQPPAPLDPLGYESLFFVFHPGDLDPATAKVLRVEVNGSAVDLLPTDLQDWDWLTDDPRRVELEGRVDPDLRRWQEVEIPLERFAVQGPIRELAFAGDGAGTVYIDDLRLRLAPGLQPVAADWSHTLPTEVFTGASDLRLSAAVRLLRFDAHGPPPSVTVDLSRLGGPARLPLSPSPDGSYRLVAAVSLRDLPPGVLRLRVRVEQVTPAGRHWHDLTHAIRVLQPDLPILDDDLADGWRVVGSDGARLVGFDAEGPVFHGRSAAAVAVQPASLFAPWSLELVPPAPVDRGGRTGLRFAFHPTDLQLPRLANLVLVVDGLALDLVRGPESLRVDLTRPEWQVVEVPFTAFDLRNRYRPGLIDSVRTAAPVRMEGNFAGTFHLDDVRLVARIPAAAPQVPVTAVAEDRVATRPGSFRLHPNHPNPFNSQTVLRYDLPRRATAVLEVYNLAGQRVARLLYGLREAGAHTVTWDGRDDADRPLASGVYVYRLQAGGQTLARKLMLIR